MRSMLAISKNLKKLGKFSKRSNVPLEPTSLGEEVLLPIYGPVKEKIC